MDSVKRSSVTPSKSRLARTFAKVLRIRSAKEKSIDEEIEKTKSFEKTKKNQLKNPEISSFEDEESAIKEAFLAKLFATISSLKAAYAQLQFCQCPYDPDGIQSADQLLVLEIKNLAELKQSFVKKQFNVNSPETTLLLSEIQEQKSLLKTYEITSKKLDSQLKLKDSEIIFLKEKLEEVNSDNKSIEKRLNSSGQLAMPENAELSSLRSSYFIAYLRQAIKSIRSFVRLLISEMENGQWDLDSAANFMEPGICFWKPGHKCFAFEAFVCRVMFAGFNNLNFSIQMEPLPEQRNRARIFFDRFSELKSVRVVDYLAWKPKSRFAMYCRAKYLNLMHPKMESSLFGNLDHRDLVSSSETPETPFFSAFSEMARRIWLLHCLAFSFDPEIFVFEVEKGCRFSEVYMESVNEEAFLLSDGTSKTDPRVGFSVVPGFRIGKTVVQCQVYLC